MRTTLLTLVVLLAVLYGCRNSDDKTSRKGAGKESEREKKNRWKKSGKQKPLVIVVENLPSGQGTVRIGVYGTGNKFPSSDDQLRTYRFTPHNGKVEQEINDLEYGELALAIYHDENNNGEIDKNGLGMPTEAYGFSNNVKPLLKAPEFSECKFDYNPDNNKVVVVLNK